MRSLTILILCGTLTACATDGGVSAHRTAGFVPLFDGYTLTGWSGDPGLWTVRDGVIVAQTHAPLGENTYLVHDGDYQNFEIHLKYRMTSDIANTGLQYRSHALAEKPHVMAGYQANIVTKNADRSFAMLFEELGRETIVSYGERARIVADPAVYAGYREVVEGCVNSRSDIMAAQKPYPAWNDYVVIAYGNHVLHALNGVVTLDAIDEDPRAAKSGQFGLQIHRGLVMGAEFKDIAVRALDRPPALKGRFSTKPRAALAGSACP